VTAATGRRRIAVSGLDDFAAGWFERGRLLWSTGGNAGRAMEVRAHRVLAGDVVIELWQATLSPWWQRRIAYAFRFPGVTD
jgi:hypothetical protein